jgi:poly-gamma-glutamate synthase PgsB/CapB
MGFRFWRFFYELLSPSPDKRQGFDHTVGRVTRGSLRCPSCIGSELTQTKVPGEPLYMPSEQGWRPYLPLVDHVITALQSCLSNAPTRVFSPEGITEIKPPRSLVLRIIARSRLTFGFARYAELRNWREEDRSRPDAYIAALERLGVRITYSPPMSSSPAEDVDDSVTRFFPAGLAFFGEESWQGIRDYFFSAYENSLFELGLFSAGLMALFLSGKLYLAGAGKWARRGLDLVIGGWGTRGKSGTERLKAALFEALGHGLVNKTTGCEAMFLYAYPFGRTREMFLFRPYDKATIWEHLNLMVMARRLGARVFLWECMGLNPAFVKILQRQWSQDDYSTITNTYPDHEDLQGPAGINIPEVMINFIPRKGVLITSEEEMKPYLVSGAQDLGCRVESVNWLEAGFLTPDIMDRFPYQEHPYNIALVVALANELGIEADFALKEMADRVVPDIGVLKVFPAAQVEGRLLEFTNGMSANERFGTLSNWRRVGFDAVDVEGSPGTILTTVVNNRADRISRSRMFASILVNDISADMHVLIGSNLSGLRGYIEEAWAEYADEIRFDTSAPDPASTARTTVLAVARRLRIPTSPGHVRGRLHAILDNLEGDFDKNGIGAQWEDPAKVKEALDQAGLGSYADDIAAYLDAQVSVLRQFTDIDQRIAAASASELTRLQATFRELAHQWFTAKLLVIEDYYATGDEIVHRITKATPPGLLNRVMGLQNIKGTGLDFVYRWQAWETCFEACSLMLSENDAAKFETGLDKLSTFQEFGLLSFEHVQDTLAQVRAKPAAQTERVQAALALIEGRLTEAVNSIRGEIGVSQTRSGVLHRIVEVVEAFLDAGDAVRRRKQADRIYRDLIDERISHERAAYELKKLNSRQKGGWLAARLGMQ